MRALLLLTLFTVSFNLLQAKDKGVKFGKVDKSDLEMTVYEADTSAVAVILYESGTSEIEYIQSTGWRLVFNKHQRIKILKKEGVAYADFQIRLNRSSSDREEVNGLKAITFNLEDGKVVEDDLSRKDVHHEEINKYNDLESFSLPNVKVGSVIDVKYSIDCKTFFRNMRPWMFQHSIPTQYSEYLVLIPEYFKFRKFVLGFESFTTSEEEMIPQTINLTSKTRSGGDFSSGGQVSTHYDYSSVALKVSSYHMVAEDLPKFEEEAFTSTVDNFIQQVQFELQAVQFPQSKLYTYSESWEQINENLTNDEDFGKVVFAPANFLDESTQQLTAGAENNIQKVVTLFKYVRDNFSFNGFHSIYSKGLRNVVKDKNGNVADINFLLAAYLQSAGFDAKPVVLSTRSNGVFLYPTVTGFNYVVVQCNVDGNKILLDAADKFSSINELPYKCLNGQGVVIGGSKPEWVDLFSVGSSSSNYISQISIQPDGTLTGKANIARTGYAAQSFRRDLSEFKSEEEFAEDYAEKRVNWEIESHEVEGVDPLEQRVVEKIDFSTKAKSVFAGDKIYVSPVIMNPTEENPFKLKERKYPVDFGYTFRESETVVFTIPEGYEIEEFPEAYRAALPDSKATYMFGVTKLGENQIHIITDFRINVPVMFAEDYDSIKQLLDLQIEKQKQQIILKKI